MSERGTPPPLPRVKTRLPFEQRPLRPGGGGLRGASLVVYAVLALGLAGLAVYNSMVAGLPLMSGYVIAPAVGAAWFGLRLFMSLAPRV